MVARAKEEHGELYTVIGLPADEGADNIAAFIDSTGSGNVTHVLGSDQYWADFGAYGVPSWMTITADGETTSGSGAFTRTLLNGEDWIPGLK